MRERIVVLLALLILLAPVMAESQGSITVGFDKKHGLSSAKFPELKKLLESEGYIVKDVDTVSEDIDILVIVNQTAPLSEGEISQLDSYVRAGHSLLIVRNAVSAVFNAMSTDDPLCTIKVIGGCDPFEATVNSTYFKYSREVIVKGSSLSLSANLPRFLISKEVWIDRDKNGRFTETDPRQSNLVLMVGQNYGMGRVVVSSVDFFSGALLSQKDNKLFTKELFSWLSSPSLAKRKYEEVRSKLSSFVNMKGDLDRVGGDSSTLLNVASGINKSLESVKAMIDRGASEEALSQLEAIERKINDYMSFVSKLVVVETKLSQFASYLEETRKSEPNISLDKFYNEVSRLNSEKRAVYEKWSAGDLSGANQTANSILNSIENLSNEAKSYVTEQKEMIKRMEEEKQRNIMIAVIAVVIVVIAVAGFLIYKRRKEKEEVSIVIKPPTG
ncbi:Gldg family protein [Candidatus Korarchaeum cryptofilum]|jgi:hypothetical protein|nr:Gldg family protein [Candidatus Korarchaeum cryptofilum]